MLFSASAIYYYCIIMLTNVASTPLSCDMHYPHWSVSSEGSLRRTVLENPGRMVTLTYNQLTFIVPGRCYVDSDTISCQTFTNGMHYT